MSQVLVVLTNWRRPDNVLRIIPAFRAQTIPVRLVVVDNAEPDYRLGTGGPDGVDDYWTMRKNHGPPCRFAPAFLEHECKYVLFYDDDCLPGPAAVEHLLENARQVGDKFSTLGHYGRRYGREGTAPKYVVKDIRRNGEPVPVDMTIRSHLILADTMHHVVKLKWKLLSRIGSAASQLVKVHDDIILCLGLQLATGFPSYLYSTHTDPARSLFLTPLPEPDAVWRRPTHMEERTQLVRYIEKLGWKSLVP